MTIKGFGQAILHKAMGGLAAFIFLPSLLAAQHPALDSLQRVLRAGDYPAAIAGYKSFLSANPGSVEGHLGLAQALTFAGEYTSAKAEFGEYILQKEATVDHYRHFAKCLLMTGNFADAMGVAQEILRQKPFDPEGENIMVLADSLDKVFTNDLSYDLLLLPFNTAANESAPSLYMGNLALSRNIEGTGNVVAYSSEIHRRGDKYSFFRPSPVWMAKSPTGWDQGAFNYNPSNQTVAVTRREAISDQPRLWPDSAAPLKIVFYDVDPDRVWDNELPFSQNSASYSNAFPCFAIGGRYLLFSSDRPGGFGGFDIYICQRQGKTWGNAVNLGPGINTKGNEVYPFVHADGTLYYSSDAQKASHDFDIYEARLTEGGSMSLLFSETGAPAFLPSTPLEFPINSALDDYGYVMEEDRRHGFFCSNRTGGVGGDDIYSLSIREMGVECSGPLPDGLCFEFYDANNLATGPTYPYHYEWNFGDGTTAQSEKVRHCYAEAGDYQVSFTITDPATGRLVSTTEGMVTAVRASQAKASGPGSARVGEKVSLDGGKSYLGNRTIVRHHWDFGDGKWATGKEVTHVYNTPGIYTVRLRVAGLSDDLKDFERKCTTLQVEVVE